MGPCRVAVVDLGGQLYRAVVVEVAFENRVGEGLFDYFDAEGVDLEGEGRGVVDRHMGTAEGITLLLAMDGALSRADACVLVLSILGYLIFRANNDEHDHADDAPNITLRKAFILAIAGLIALPFGADLFLQGALALAHKFGLNDEMIGLTVVALGTSVPELATCIVAAIRRDVDIVIGNILGSNFFNLTLVMGGAALVQPLSVARNFVELGNSILLAVTILSLIFMFTGAKLCRKEGATMLALYAFIISIWVV